jgi:hypothetical protein
MKYRLLAFGAVALALAVFVAQSLVAGETARSQLFFATVLLAKLMALGGALLAGTSFKKGDYLRRAWLCVAGDYLVILAKDLLFGGYVFTHAENVWFGQDVHLPGIDPRSLLAGGLRAGFVFVANGLAVLGAVLLARAWRVAGLELPGTQARQRAIVIVIVVVSVTILGTAVWVDLADFWHTHQAGALGAVISDVGDLLSFCLTAPVLMTAWALRGGKLMWPWALFTVAQLAWMLFDAVGTFGSLTRLPAAELRGVTETLRALACALVLAAGLAQRWAVARRVRSEGSGL